MLSKDRWAEGLTAQRADENLQAVHAQMSHGPKVLSLQSEMFQE
jgi:hypothetical protein